MAMNLLRKFMPLFVLAGSSQRKYWIIINLLADLLFKENIYMTIPIIPCFYCIHLDEKEWVCSAFPNGIPEEILTGENDHTKPLPDQENDIVYAPIE